MNTTPQSQDKLFSLRVLPLEHVIPHERVDPERVARLVARLRESMILKNPPIVAQWDDRYVVLDGATRYTAFLEMGFEHIVAQVVQSTDQALTLQTWKHIKQGMPIADLLQLVQAVPEIVMTPASTEAMLADPAGNLNHCHLALSDGRVFRLETVPEQDWFPVLHRLVDSYLESGQVDRTRLLGMAAVKEEHPDLIGLFVFPQFTIEQVLHIARTGHVVPAGITRFVIPGRVLRINLDLHRLRQPEPLATKSRWLDEHIVTLIGNHRMRYYEEPVYLFDE